MTVRSGIRDHFLPPDADAYRRAEPSTGRVIVIAPTRAACETIEMAMALDIETVLEREHGSEIRGFARDGQGFGIVAGTGTGKTLAIRSVAAEILRAPLRVGVVNREREATPETPTWNVVIVTTGIARRWFQDNLIEAQDTLVADEIHQTSAELELCLALGKRIGCRFIWLSATVDPSFYARYLNSSHVLETTAFDPELAARVESRQQEPLEFLDDRFVRRLIKERRGLAVFLPTRAEVEQVASVVGERWRRLYTAFYHGGEPIRVIRPFLDGSAPKPFLLTMTQAGQSALNVRGLDTVAIYDACYNSVIDRGRSVLTRQHLGANEILQMAGRVHGRVAGGEVYLLTDRDIDFAKLEPTPPEFQLGGDTERVALTAAALGVDLTELELPVALDRQAYRRAVRMLSQRGLVENGRLTGYGRNVEAMPVDRPWGELLVHADDDLVPYLAVASNIDSLHRLTRDECDLRGLVVRGSDHLTGYNVFAEAVNSCGYVGEVYGLPRHLFTEEIEAWSARRGVLVKAMEDVALGTASVMRTLERPLQSDLPLVTPGVLARFRDLVARIMPFALVIEEEMANGEGARISQSSVCDPRAAVAGTVSYFADRYGIPRAAVEGTNIPFKLIKRYATRSGPSIELRSEAWGRRSPQLVATYRTEYFGFVLDLERVPVVGRFPAELAEQARDALAEGLRLGRTSHPDQQQVTRSVNLLDEYWRRSGGTIAEIRPEVVRQYLRGQVDEVGSWEEFLEVPIDVDLEASIPAEELAGVRGLPRSADLLGRRIPLVYEIEDGRAVARLKLREGLARRLRKRDVPRTDRPLRFSVYRGKREVAKAESFDDLQRALERLPPRRGRQRR